LSEIDFVFRTDGKKKKGFFAGNSELIDELAPKEIPLETAIGIELRQPTGFGGDCVLADGQNVAEGWADAEIAAFEAAEFED
jgi:hypothetical protein